jgi:hypothetical protein
MNPLFIVFNIHLTHYNAYGTTHYKRIINSLQNRGKANLKDVHLIPNITNLSSTIESRAKSLSE